MFDLLWRPWRRTLASPLLIALMLALTAGTLGVVALFAMGRLRFVDAIFLAAVPWVLLAAAFRPDWLILALIAAPASFTAGIQTKRMLLLVIAALVALLITRRRFSLGLGTGLLALIILNAVGYLFVADVGQGAIAANYSTMLGVTYYVLLALLAFNLAMLEELDGTRLAVAIVIGAATTLIVGIAGYGGAWFESGTGIITQTYLAPMISAAFGVTLAWNLALQGSADSKVGYLVMTGILLFLAIVSLSRATWIAVTITVALLAFRSGRRGYVLVLMVAIVLALLTPTARQQVSRSESGDIIAELRSGEITTGRWKLWTELSSRAEMGLPWGNGFGYVWSLSSDDIFGVPGEFQSEESGVVPPHNDFIYMAVEFGIPGVLLLLLFWIQLFRAQFALTESADPSFRRSGWLLLGVLVTGLVFSQVDDLFAVRPLAERFFPVAGFVFGLAQLDRSRRPVSKSKIVGDIEHSIDGASL